MRKVGADLPGVIAQMGGDREAARKNLRIQQVRERYREAIESVYPPQTAKLHLNHTNKVIITTINGVCTLIVYVDESLFAAELNAQRELIKLRLLELFGEEIEDFQIKISRWRNQKEEHPYVDESKDVSKNTPTIPLDVHEKSFVSRTIGKIEDEKIKKSLERAMTADLKWKKGEKVERERKNSK